MGWAGIRTTPYHPLTDGLVERYNQTLKVMVRRMVAVGSKDWDRWLPYLMFTYREVLTIRTPVWQTGEGPS